MIKIMCEDIEHYKEVVELLPSVLESYQKYDKSSILNPVQSFIAYALPIRRLPRINRFVEVYRTKTGNTVLNITPKTYLEE